jgi:hypothetical protein
MREVQKAYRARLKRSHPAEDYVAAEVLKAPSMNYRTVGSPSDIEKTAIFSAQSVP